MKQQQSSGLMLVPRWQRILLLLYDKHCEMSSNGVVLQSWLSRNCGTSYSHYCRIVSQLNQKGLLNYQKVGKGSTLCLTSNGVKCACLLRCINQIIKKNQGGQPVGKTEGNTAVKADARL